MIHQTPLAEVLYGLTNTLADPALCGNNQALNTIGGAIPSAKDKKGGQGK